MTARSRHPGVSIRPLQPLLIGDLIGEDSWNGLISTSQSESGKGGSGGRVPLDRSGPDSSDPDRAEAMLNQQPTAFEGPGPVANAYA